MLKFPPPLSANSVKRGDPSLAVFLPMDEGAGEVCYDHSGYGNTGAFSGTVRPARSLHSAGRTCEMGGALSSVLVPGNPVVPGTDTTRNITYSVWVRANTFTNAYQNIMASRESSGVAALLVKSSGKLALYFDIAGGPAWNYDGTGAYTLIADTWAFLTATAGATGVYGYVNGLLDGSNVTSGSSLSISGLVDFFVGVDPTYSGREFDGSMRDARIHNRMLSAGEVWSLYQSYFLPKRAIPLARRKLVRSVGMASVAATRPNIFIAT